MREDVGVLDMSLMAKFLVQGPDAERVLERLSVSVVGREIGRLVYAMAQHRGRDRADLTVTRLGAEKFLVVTSDLIHRRVEPMIRREARPDEVVVVTEITSGTTLLSVQGPKSRTLLSRLSDADLSNAAFPYLSAKQIHVGYAPVLAVRVTYLGELGWELHIPAEYAAGVFDELTTPVPIWDYVRSGLAAMSSLRLEKGYRDIGVDIDNTDNPIDAGLGFTVAWDKPVVSSAATLCWSSRPRDRRATGWSTCSSTTPRPTCSAMSPCWSTATGSDTCGRLRTATPSAVRSAWRRCRTRPG